MANNLKLDQYTSNALSRLQDTELSPMEEALFRAWSKANGVQDPDAPEDHMDYRGLYKASGGKVLPFGELEGIARRTNNEERLTQTLLERMEDMQGDEQDRADKKQDQDFKERQSRVKLISDQQKLKLGEVTNKGKEIELQGKPYENEALRYQNEAKTYDNEAKRINLITKMLTGMTGNGNAGNTGTTAGQAAKASKGTSGTSGKA